MTGSTTDLIGATPESGVFPVEESKDVGVKTTNEPTLPMSTETDQHAKSWLRKRSWLKACWDVVSWTPPWCRWDPDKPPKFSLSLNLLFAFAGSFTVANLYYNHPILNVLAEDFGKTFEEISVVPTVMQAGYATGLLFLCPLGDIVPRRPFTLILVWFTATMWVGLCITTSYPTFVAISFITGVTTVTPQLMLPLVGDLAPPNRRATCLSIVVSGIMMGLLIARLLSGILTQYTSWRSIYWLGFAMQYLIVILLWLFMPDYPSTNPEGINYFRILYSIVTIVIKEPVLVQACLVGFFTSSVFMSFWTTLTFLLASPPFNYSPIVIGLFAFIGIGAMILNPLVSRLVIDRFVPIFSVFLGLGMTLVGVTVGTYIGEFTAAGPAIEAFLIDIGTQTAQIANRSAIYGIAPKARNRVNTAYMVSTFCGQLMGTAVGNRLYAEGGWTRAGSASVGMVCAAILVCFVRSPWHDGWVGWSGGWSIRRRDLGPAKRDEPAVEMAQDDLSAEEGHGQENEKAVTRFDTNRGEETRGERVAKRSEA